jgi:predicted TIM-barrel fold metal-dependent hydrolase
MYNGQKVFDVHGHVSAPAAARSWIFGQMASNTAQRSPLFRQGGGGGGEGRGGNELSDEAFMTANKRHADYMTERNIDVQIIGPRPFTMLGWMEDHLLPGWAEFTNDTIQKQVLNFPDRFLGASMLPQNSAAADLSHCLPELERVKKEFNFVATYLSPDPAGHRTTPGVNESYWYPLYERLQEYNMPIIVHGTNCMDRRHRPLPQNYQIGFVMETYLATQLYSHTDVFEKFPNLKIIMCHCGGALNRFIPTDRHLSQKNLSNNLFYDTCIYDIPYIECALKQRGVSQICFGTEAPGSGGAVRPETGKTSDDLVPIISQIGFLSEEDKVTIFNKNPQKVVPQFK